MATKKQSNLLQKYFPNLDVTRESLVEVVSKTDSDTLHEVFSKLDSLLKIFKDIVKDAFIQRIKNFKVESPNEKFTTTVGNISLVSRSNFSLTDEEKFIEFLKKNNIPLYAVYDYSYSVVTKNTKVLKTLLERGYIVEKKTIDWKKVNNVSTVYEGILDFVDNNPTEYLKGL